MRIDGTMPGAARHAELCLQMLLAARAGGAVELRRVPDLAEAGAELVEHLEVPEAAAGAVSPQRLTEVHDVIAGFVHEREPVRPRPFAEPRQVELGKALGLAVGQPIEVSVDDAWFHAKVLGFTKDGAVRFEWLGGGEAEIPGDNVRPSQRPPEPERSPKLFGRLVLVGELRPRTAAKFQAMAAVDRKVGAHFAERFGDGEASRLFGFGEELATLSITITNVIYCYYYYHYD